MVAYRPHTPSGPDPTAPDKSRGKRNTARAALLFLAAFFVWGVFEPAAMDAAKHLSAPVFLFATFAFTADGVSKHFKG